MSNRSRAQTGSSPWPLYEAAREGLEEYWYPVAFSKQLKRRPMTVRILNQPIMLKRENGRVHALYDQCPHRGVPLSLGRQEFPASWTCRYHGWTFDLKSGELRAALTDGPDSAICGKVRVRTMPVEERAGLIWVYMGEADPPPVEDDIPSEFLEKDAVVVGKVSVRRGNWRYAAENGFDASHAMYLHRDAYYVIFRHKPIWGTIKLEAIDEEGWLSRKRTSINFSDTYPGFGHWPKVGPWEVTRASMGVAIRLPGILRVRHRPWTHYEWYVPIDGDNHRYVQFLVKRTTGIKKWIFRLRYSLYVKPLFHGHFNSQDSKMVELMPETFPDRFFRPDKSITAWRKMFEHARTGSHRIEKESGTTECHPNREESAKR